MLAFSDAGVLRLQNEAAVALVRTRKLPRDALYGGAVGGGTLVYVGSADRGPNRLAIDREAALVEANFTLVPRLPAWRSWRAELGGLRRHGWFGAGLRQWLFVARLLMARGRPLGAAGRLWRGYLRPLAAALGGRTASQWALGTSPALVEDGVVLTCVPARLDGSVPGWAAPARVTRRYRLAGETVAVEDLLCYGPARNESSARGDVHVFRDPPPTGGSGVTPIARRGALIHQGATRHAHDTWPTSMNSTNSRDSADHRGAACGAPTLLARSTSQPERMPGHAVRCVAYLLPRRARDVQVAASGRVVRRGAAGRRVEMWPELPGFWLRLSYTL